MLRKTFFVIPFLIVNYNLMCRLPGSLLPFRRDFFNAELDFCIVCLFIYLLVPVGEVSFVFYRIIPALMADKIGFYWRDISLP